MIYTTFFKLHYNARLSNYSSVSSSLDIITTILILPRYYQQNLNPATQVEYNNGLTRVWRQHSLHIPEYLLCPVLCGVGSLSQVFKVGIKLRLLWRAQRLLRELNRTKTRPTLLLIALQATSIPPGSMIHPAGSRAPHQQSHKRKKQVSLTVFSAAEKTYKSVKRVRGEGEISSDSAPTHIVCGYVCIRGENRSGITWTTLLRAAPASFTSFFTLKSIATVALCFLLRSAQATRLAAASWLQSVVVPPSVVAQNFWRTPTRNLHTFSRTLSLATLAKTR